jgi:hypothetical protein
MLPAVTTVAATTTTAAAASATTASMATASAAISTTAGPPTAAAASTFCLGTGFVHYQVAPPKILAIQGIHGAIGVFVVIHFHERESPGLPGEAVADEINA